MTNEQNEENEVTIDESSALSMPLAGGPSLIFAMARRMLIWDENEMPSDTPKKRRTLPRWHPHAGISDTNPSFRSTSPKMNSFGYSAAIRRNSRKRSGTLQRYALRVYNERFRDSGLPKSIIHYEGAFVACSKLGLWRDALDILQDVECVMEEKNDVYVNDAMIMAFVKACVRGSKRDKSLSTKEKRKSLDVARDFLNSIEKKYNIQVSPKHLLPLASAYKKLKLYNESEILLQKTLSLIETQYPKKSKRIRKETLQQVKELQAHKRASYSLLVKQSAEKEDWENAILNLKGMVEDGVYFPTKGKTEFI